MIRALVCDFGGVLTTPLSAGFLAYQAEAGVSLEELGAAMGRATEEHGEHPLFALERGEITEVEFARRLGDGLRADECVFLDDLEVNCEAARALGMTVVRFEHPDQAIPELESATGLTE